MPKSTVSIKEDYERKEIRDVGRMKQAKRIRKKLNKGSKMIIHTRIKYSILLIIIFSICFSSPTIFADEEAIEACKQAIRINPDNAEAHFALGAAYAFLNDRVSALEQYKILKSLDLERANKLFNRIYK
jgi:tetratricopeptide (TPR) repeat protein